MEAAATAATRTVPFAPHRSSTRRSPAPSLRARAIRVPPVIAATPVAHSSHKDRPFKRGEAAADQRRSCVNNSKASTFLAGCYPVRDAGDASSSTANSGAASRIPPPPMDLENPMATEQSPPLQPHGMPASEATVPQLPSSSSEGLVFDLGPAGAWDGREVGSPVVKRYVGDNKERWLMWYHGCGDGDHPGCSIGLAVSANGIHWKRGGGQVESMDGTGLVMRRSGDWWAFDTESLTPAEVLIMSSAKVKAPGAVYWLYYTGFTSEKVDIPTTPPPAITGGPVLRSLPGLAISQDGRHWARIEGEHHSGALLDVGPPGEWDSLFLASPTVLYHGRGDLRMYYHSFDPACGQFGIGVARSRDGIRWVKLGKAVGGGAAGCFDELGAMNGHVVRNGKDGGYLMLYEGVDGGGRSSIGLAESPDGLKEWRRCGEGALLGASSSGWDDGGVGSPCLVQMDGEEGWRLYYRGDGKGGRTGIGLALSEGSEEVKVGCFRRWTGFCSLKSV